MTDRHTALPLYQLFSVQQSVLSSSAATRTNCTLDELQQMILSSKGNSYDNHLLWTTELALVFTAYPLRQNIENISSLLRGFGCDPLDVICSSDTVQFNAHISRRAWGALSTLMTPRQSYSVSDNAFGIFWTWEPTQRKTVGIMYGSIGEGWRQSTYSLSDTKSHGLGVLVANLSQWSTFSMAYRAHTP
jgi:hypothetical protein